MKHIFSEAWPNGFQMRCVLQLSQLIQLCLGLWLLWGSRNSRFSWHERMPFLHSRVELNLQNSPKLLQRAARGIKMTACSISEHAAPHTRMLEANDWGVKKREESDFFRTDRGCLQTKLHAILSFLHMEVITKLFQICGGVFVFIRLLQVRYVKVSAEQQLFVTLSTPHDAEVIKPTHNDSTLTRTPHKSEAEIYQ